MGFQIKLGPPNGEEICDFCSSPKIYGIFPAKDFTHDVIDGVGVNSLSDWAACKECHDLIQAENWHELLERSVRTFHQRYPDVNIPSNMLREQIGVLHKQFREHRTQIH